MPLKLLETGPALSCAFARLNPDQPALPTLDDMDRHGDRISDSIWSNVFLDYEIHFMDIWFKPGGVKIRDAIPMYFGEQQFYPLKTLDLDASVNEIVSISGALPLFPYDLNGFEFIGIKYMDWYANDKDRYNSSTQRTLVKWLCAHPELDLVGTERHIEQVFREGGPDRITPLPPLTEDEQAALAAIVAAKGDMDFETALAADAFSEVFKVHEDYKIFRGMRYRFGEAVAREVFETYSPIEREMLKAFAALKKAWSS